MYKVPPVKCIDVRTQFIYCSSMSSLPTLLLLKDASANPLPWNHPIHLRLNKANSAGVQDYAASSAAAGLSILHDLMIMALPIPTLWGLQLSWQKRLHLLAMFSFGIFTVLCSILRIPSLMNFRKSTDPSCMDFLASQGF